jgi:hypothetical protein
MTEPVFLLALSIAATTVVLIAILAQGRDRSALGAGGKPG